MRFSEEGEMNNGAEFDIYSKIFPDNRGISGTLRELGSPPNFGLNPQREPIALLVLEAEIRQFIIQYVQVGSVETDVS